MKADVFTDPHGLIEIKTQKGKVPIVHVRDKFFDAHYEDLKRIGDLFHEAAEAMKGGGD